MPSRPRHDHRGEWCTPRPIWRAPLVAHNRTTYDLDPFASRHSSVRAKRKLYKEDGFDSRPWGSGMVWLQPPYVTTLLRAAFELARESSATVYGCVPIATETAAWQQHGPNVVWFLGRVAFDPPPGIQPSHPDNREIGLVCWTPSGLSDRDTVRRIAASLAVSLDRRIYYSTGGMAPGGEEGGELPF